MAGALDSQADAIREKLEAKPAKEFNYIRSQLSKQVWDCPSYNLHQKVIMFNDWKIFVSGDDYQEAKDLVLLYSRPCVCNRLKTLTKSWYYPTLKVIPLSDYRALERCRHLRFYQEKEFEFLKRDFERETKALKEELRACQAAVQGTDKTLKEIMDSLIDLNGQMAQVSEAIVDGFEGGEEDYEESDDDD